VQIKPGHPAFVRLAVGEGTAVQKVVLLK